MKKNKYGFIVRQVNLRYTANIMLACSINEGITWEYFGRRQYGSLINARDAMEKYLHSQHKENNRRDDFQIQIQRHFNIFYN